MIRIITGNEVNMQADCGWRLSGREYMDFFEEEVELEDVKKQLLTELYQIFKECGISKVTIMEDLETYRKYSRNIIIFALRELVKEDSIIEWPLCNGYSITPEAVKAVEGNN